MSITANDLPTYSMRDKKRFDHKFQIDFFDDYLHIVSKCFSKELNEVLQVLNRGHLNGNDSYKNELAHRLIRSNELAILIEEEVRIDVVESQNLMNSVGLEHDIIKHKQFMKLSHLERVPPKWGVKLKIFNIRLIWFYGSTPQAACDNALAYLLTEALIR